MTYYCNHNYIYYDASLLVNYVYLDTDERRRFAQVSHEYLIEQVQHTGVESIGANGGSIDLTFNHPVKGLFWRGFAEIQHIRLNYS